MKDEEEWDDEEAAPPTRKAGPAPAADARVARLERLLVERGIVAPGEAARLPAGGMLDYLRRSGRLGPEVLRRLESEASLREILDVFPGAAPDLPKDAERIAHYVLSRKVGEGGMGEVWKAWDETLHRWVALKFVKGHSVDDVQRFLREANLASRLEHPGIVRVYEVGTDPSRPYIAMEFIDGRPLTGARVDPRRAAEIVRDAALAVQHAHDQRVVHRDLKPGNLMETKDGRVLVMDFGLARTTVSGGTLTATGAFLGTPSYMSPEQAKGMSGDARSDVYSLGATLYELLARRLPFTAENTLGLARKIMEDAPAPLRRGTDPDLATITFKCLEKDPAVRFATAKDLADDLTRWIEGDPILARPPSTLYRVRKFLTRRLPVVLAAAAGLLLTAIVAAILVPKWIGEKKAKAERETELTTEREKRRETEIFVPLEKELDVLRERFYRPDFRVTDEEAQRYEELKKKLLAQMDRSGQSAQCWHLLGRCCEVLCESDHAKEAYEKALSIDSAHGPSLLRQGRLAIAESVMRVARIGSNEIEREHALQAAREAIRRGLALADGGMSADLAAAWLELLEKRTESTFQAQPMLEKWKREPLVEEFLIIEAIAEWSKALPLLDEAVRRAPSYPEAYLWRGITRVMRKDVDGAIADLERAVQIQPRFTVGWNTLGRALREKSYRLGRDEGMTLRRREIECYEKAIALRPRDSWAWGNRGSAKYETGDFAGGEADMNQAIQLDPLVAQHWSNRGLLRRTLKQYDRALEDFDEALRLKAEQPEMYYARGEIKYQTGDKDGAIADFSRELEQNPKHLSARYMRAVLYVERKEWTGAIADCTEVLQARPRMAEAFYYRGCARFRTEEHAGALDDLTKAIEIKPAYAQAYYFRCAVKQATGDEAGAIADGRKALEIGLPEPMKKNMQDMLRKLEER